MSVGSWRAGFTLIELVVALTLVTVGLLAFAGNVATASRLLGRAEALEIGVTLVGAVADSLGRHGFDGAGERLAPVGRVTWEGGGDTLAAVTIRAFVPPTSLEPVVEANALVAVARSEP